ncbi:amino acid permease [Acidocella sp.]|uniref:amino acid permease n=1 Tax=Acidocella sp. TaxID=50710 RepID=UPI00260B3B53|nr:amino acid permease [Acidocella sp.]
MSTAPPPVTAQAAAQVVDGATRPHPRRIGWVGTSALAVGGSNQSLFLLAALFAGQGAIPGQGSAAVPLLLLGLGLSYMAAPGWLELVLMYPNRVGGIAAACTDAFRPYGDILSVLTGVCYWWGWVPTCGVTALFSAGALQHWLPGVPVEVIAVFIILAFLGVNIGGIRLTTRVAVAVACLSTSIAFLAALVPVLAGTVNWRAAFDYQLATPFPGLFGQITSAMAGLYLIGFGAPAFEAALCHVGETIDQNRNVPRALLANALLAGLYFGVLPVVWFGVLGGGALGGDLSQTLGPVFAPLFGAAGRYLALWFVIFNMFHGTLQPIAGAARVLSQLSEDGLLPRMFAKRCARTDAPWVAALTTAALAILFMLIGDPVWLIAAANFSYLIGIALPNVAVWLARRDAPGLPRPFRAPRGTLGLGLAAAAVWGGSTVLGFEQFGLPTVVLSMALAYSGGIFYIWRRLEDGALQGQIRFGQTLHMKLTGAMLAVLALDAAGYMIAVGLIPPGRAADIAMLDDIFVAVAMLTVTVGIVLPGMIGHAAREVSRAASRLIGGVLADFAQAVEALGKGELEAAHVTLDIQPVTVRAQDELGLMAANFNLMQERIGGAIGGLDNAREGLKSARDRLTEINAELRKSVEAERRLSAALREARDAALAASRAKSEFLANMSHELRTPMNGILGMAGLLAEEAATPRLRQFAETIQASSEALLGVICGILDFSKLEKDEVGLEEAPCEIEAIMQGVAAELAPRAAAKGVAFSWRVAPALRGRFMGDAARIAQVARAIIGNAVKFTETGAVRVLVDETRAEGTEVVVRFAVQDTGIGIAPEEQARVFGEFSQEDGSTTRRHDGVGLGLAIANRLVERMGGGIEVVSSKGAGSLFVFTMRLKRLPEIGGQRAGDDRLIDWQAQAELRETLGVERFGQLIRHFCATLAPMIETLRGALRSGEAVAPGQIVQALRGSAANLGLTGLGEMLAGFEGRQADEAFVEGLAEAARETVRQLRDAA